MMYGLSPTEYFWFVTCSYILLVGGAILFWLGFFFIGRVAKKYEKVLNVKTNWIFLYLAPSGYMIFAGIIFISGVVLGYIKPPVTLEWISYIFSLISGITILIGIIRFSNLIFKK